jgi:hypothetical protein
LLYPFFTSILSSLTARDAYKKVPFKRSGVFGDKISIYERQIKEGTEKNTGVTF